MGLALQLVHDLLFDIQYPLETERFIERPRIFAVCRLLDGARGYFYGIQKPVIFEALLDEEANGPHGCGRQP